jgi:hypothetical protein
LCSDSGNTHLYFREALRLGEGVIPDLDTMKRYKMTLKDVKKKILENSAIKDCKCTLSELYE